jgi:hypothetical protein
LLKDIKLTYKDIDLISFLFYYIYIKYIFKGEIQTMNLIIYKNPFQTKIAPNVKEAVFESKDFPEFTGVSIKEFVQFLHDKGYDLSKVNLEKVDLSDLNLDGINLEKAHLYKTNLERTSLRGANLSRANMYRVNIHEADLTGANIYRADFKFSNRYRVKGLDVLEINKSELANMMFFKNHMQLDHIKESYSEWIRIFKGEVSCSYFKTREDFIAHANTFFSVLESNIIPFNIKEEV